MAAHDRTPRRILLAVTSHDGPLGRRPTGAWLGEITAFWHAVTRAGFAVDFVSPRGGKPPIDPMSALSPGPSNVAFPERARDALEHSRASADVDPRGYEAIYFAGGHGTLWDFPDDAGLASLTEAIWRRGGVVAAVCHGPAGLLHARDTDGTPIVTGRRMTVFTNAEERLLRLDTKVPFLLETRLRELGAYVERASLPFARHVVVDGRLVTGQNPLSARAVGRAVVATLRSDRALAPSRFAPAR